MSLVLMFSSGSDLEARQHQQSLLTLVQQLVQDNAEIKRRLEMPETSSESENILTTCFRNGKSAETAETEGSTSNPAINRQNRTPMLHTSSNSVRPLDFRPTLENVLNDSRVYRLTKSYESDISFTSSGVRSHC